MLAYAFATMLLFWLLFLFYSLIAYPGYVTEARERLHHGMKPGALKVAAAFQGLWLYGGVSMVLFGFTGGLAGVLLGLGIGLVFAVILVSATSSAARKGVDEIQRKLTPRGEIEPFRRREASRLEQPSPPDPNREYDSTPSSNRKQLEIEGEERRLEQEREILGGELERLEKVAPAHQEGESPWGGATTSTWEMATGLNNRAAREKIKERLDEIERELDRLDEEWRRCADKAGSPPE